MTLWAFLSSGQSKSGLLIGGFTANANGKSVTAALSGRSSDVQHIE